MVSLLIVLLLISLAINGTMFLIAYRLQSDKLTDISYAASFVALDVFEYWHATQHNTYSFILFILVLLWAARIGGFLLIRVRKVGKDSRFDNIRTNFIAFGRFWLGQAITVWVLMIPVALAQYNASTIKTMALLGTGLWLAGLLVEAIADFQKYAFKQKPENRNKWIETGLWGYSRHPNYFGEILVWLAIYVYCFNGLVGWEKIVGLLSPMFITILLLFVSGIPILEESADERWGKQPEYKKYKARTSLLIPRWPTK